MDCLNSQMLEDVMKIRRLRWAGCVIRMSDSALPAAIINCNPEGTRILGGPKARWLIALDNDVRKHIR